MELIGELIPHLESLSEILAGLAETSAPARRMRQSISPGLEEAFLLSNIKIQGTADNTEDLSSISTPRGDIAFNSSIDPNAQDILFLAAIHIPELFDL